MNKKELDRLIQASIAEDMEQQFQNTIPTLTVDGIAKHKKDEEKAIARAKVASKVKEVIEVSRMMLVNNPTIEPSFALKSAETFVTVATEYATEALKEFDKEEPESSLITVGNIQ